MEFNEKLVYLRKTKGMSQEQLAEQVDVTRQSVSKWELGESMPDIDKLIILSKLFAIPIDSMVDNSKGLEIPQGEAKHSIFQVAKQKGYLIGYFVMGYGGLQLAASLFASFMFKQMLVPEGFGLTLNDLPAQMKMPLYLTNIVSMISLIIIAAGFVLTRYLKKKFANSQ